MAKAYYNEIDPYCVAWLKNLITAGLIPHGDVDDRSIEDVQPGDLDGYTQVHMFSGLGGWGYALRLAGWPDDRPVWTGSCPCQPFSVAGKGAGVDDPRHLWPHFHRLIRAGRPLVVMGEQVAAKAGYGWFDGVASDLEAEGYACRAVDIPACSVNAPTVRARLYWLASLECQRLERSLCQREGLRGVSSAPSKVGSNHSISARFQNRPDPDIISSLVGLPRPVGSVHALGNAICPPLAAEVIAAYMETCNAR